MAKDEIIRKLNNLLENHPFLDEEWYVMYLLVESKKILDRDNNSNFPLIKFYRDWTVHTKKEYQLGAIQEIVDKIDSCYPKGSHHPVKDDGIFDFLNMNALKIEFQEFFQKYTLTLDVLKDNEWQTFVDTLTMILSDQPILNPGKGIESIELVPFGKGHSTIDIKFNDGRTDSMAGGERW